MTTPGILLEAVRSFPGTLPSDLIDDLIAISDDRGRLQLASRPELTLEHTTALLARSTHTGSVPSALLAAHLRACGTTQALESALTDQVPETWAQHYKEMEKRFNFLSWSQLHYLATEASSAYAVALLARYGPGNLDDRLLAIKRAQVLLQASTLDYKQWRAVLNCIEAAVYDLREESSWHGEQAFLTITDGGSTFETFLDQENLTDAELQHATLISLVPYLDLEQDMSHPDDWARKAINDKGARMHPRTLDTIAAHPAAGPLHDVLEAARAAQHDIARLGGPRGLGRDTPIARWLDVLTTHGLEPGEWTVALKLLDSADEETATLDIAQVTLTVLSDTATA